MKLAQQTDSIPTDTKLIHCMNLISYRTEIDGDQTWTMPKASSNSGSEELLNQFVISLDIQTWLSELECICQKKNYELSWMFLVILLGFSNEVHKDDDSLKY